MRKFLLTIVAILALQPCKAILSQEWHSILVAPQKFAPVPRADDAFWCDSIPGTMRQSYIEYGERYLGKPWQTLPYSVFAEFKTTGNRVNYEGLCFEKRRQLAALAMAEIMEGKGRFVKDVIDGLGSIIEETWWGIPAHYGKPFPQYDLQEVDLFNAETAGLIAWTAYMLKPQLDAFSPDLCPLINNEIKRRILTPAIKGNYWWKTAGMNWNPWICSNWLACVLFCEANREDQMMAIDHILSAMNAFVKAYKDDGGCDEGPGYWDRAAASLFDELSLLKIATGGRYDWSKNEKFRAMGSYVYKTYIGNDYCVNFADSHDNKAIQQVNIVYPFGLYLDDSLMRGFAAYLGQQKHILENPAALYDKSGNFPTLGRELMFLRHICDFIEETPREPLLKDVWLGDLQIMTARRNNLFVAMKGGTNGENHNHNDVGSFIVYADGEPLLIDPGVGEYTSKTFSKERYTIWTMQSQYHNLPQINGIDQKDGKEYAAKVIGHKDGQLTLDIAGAYPEETGVKSWKRTVTAMKSAISITEDYELGDYRQPAKLMLITTSRPSLSSQSSISSLSSKASISSKASMASKATIAIGDRCLNFDSNQLDASVEDISPLLDPLLQRIWGKEMYRIVLTVKSTKTKETIKYTIQ